MARFPDGQPGRLGWKDFIDIMAGVDEVIKRVYYDENKMGVMGWSYGGFMSSWIVGHTNRFKVLQSGRRSLTWGSRTLPMISRFCLLIFNRNPGTTGRFMMHTLPFGLFKMCRPLSCSSIARRSAGADQQRDHVLQCPAPTPGAGPHAGDAPPGTAQPNPP